MRLRDGLTQFVIGGAVTKVLLWLGWIELYHPANTLFVAAITIGMIYAVSAIYDRYVIVRRA